MPIMDITPYFLAMVRAVSKDFSLGKEASSSKKNMVRSDGTGRHSMLPRVKSSSHAAAQGFINEDRDGLEVIKINDWSF